MMVSTDYSTAQVLLLKFEKWFYNLNNSIVENQRTNFLCGSSTPHASITSPTTNSANATTYPNISASVEPGSDASDPDNINIS